MPFFACWQGCIPAGRVTDELIAPVDIMPSLCALSGVPIPRTVEGVDLSEAFLGGKPARSRDDTLIMNFNNYAQSPNYIRTDGNEWRGVRTRRYTYVQWREGQRMLYDLQADCGQMCNLIGDPAQAAVEARLAARLRELLTERGDELHPSQYYRDWLDCERRVIRNAFGPLPHPDEPPDWSLLRPAAGGC